MLQRTAMFRLAAFTMVTAMSATALGLSSSAPSVPVVINTWGGPFTAATDAAFEALAATPSANLTALDAVQIGCATCERNQCDGSVGYGGSPDENCETTLDALIMDGTTLNTGAVAGLRRIRNAIDVARLVLDYTDHSMLSGDLATQFAVGFGGLVEGDLSTAESVASCREWKASGCQPNYRAGQLAPDPEKQCGPYSPTTGSSTSKVESDEVELKGRYEVYGSSGGRRSHDTISMIAIHPDGTMAAGTSTNGATHKVPGRVGDGPIAGSGSYVDGEVGGCGATGDGDIMMRFLPCYQAVESMRRGMPPQAAADDAVRRIIRKYPDAHTGIVVLNSQGEHGGAASGWDFTYSFRDNYTSGTRVISVIPLLL